MYNYVLLISRTQAPNNHSVIKIIQRHCITGHNNRVTDRQACFFIRKVCLTDIRYVNLLGKRTSTKRSQLDTVVAVAATLNKGYHNRAYSAIRMRTRSDEWRHRKAVRPSRFCRRRSYTDVCF